MLDAFITSNRGEILALTRSLEERRSATPLTNPALTGVPLFLDQLVARLAGDRPSIGDIGVSATAHGGEMLREGFSVAQVVQGYGDVCQAVTQLAISRNEAIAVEEFQMLNHCLDVATADAVSEYEHQRDRATSGKEVERMGMLAHEMRNQLGTALLSFDILTRGTVGVGGSTGAALGRSLGRLRDTIDRELASVRLDAGVKTLERVRVSEFFQELELAEAFAASITGVKLTIACEDGGAEVEIDRHILASAVGNLLQNALKFTHEGGMVTLSTHISAARVLIDVADECGGLPPGGSEALFKPYAQRGTDRTGLGLGLAITRRGIEANGGAIHVRNLPHKGCVFTIDLPAATPLA